MTLSAKEGPHHETLFLEVGGGDANNFTSQIDTFKKNKGIHTVLGFSGGADDDTPLLNHLRGKIETFGKTDKRKKVYRKILDDSGKEYVAGIVRSILRELRPARAREGNSPIAILTGGTSWGVPDVATRVAKELGFTTIGVFPLTAKTKGNVLPLDLLDLAVCVHPFIYSSQWGDEAPIYTKLLDNVVVIGGNAGTMVEVAHVLKLNERKDVMTKHILPVYGTGGTADKLSFFPGKPKIMAKCIPSHPLTSGEEVLQYLKDNILSDEDYDQTEKET